MFKDAIIGISAAMAKQEKVRLGERTKAGLAKAVAGGKQLGRPAGEADTIEKVKRLKTTGTSNHAIATALDLSPSTMSKYLLSR